MDTEKNKATVKRYYEEVWNQFNIDAIDEIFTPDYRVPNAPPWRKPGVQGLREFVTDNHRMFPDLVYQVDDLVAEKDKVAVRFSGGGTHKGDLVGPVGLVPATNRKVTWRGIMIFEFRNGKIIESNGVTNNMELMQQLGVVRSPDAV